VCEPITPKRKDLITQVVMVISSVSVLEVVGEWHGVAERDVDVVVDSSLYFDSDAYHTRQPKATKR